MAVYSQVIGIITHYYRLIFVALIAIFPNYSTIYYFHTGWLFFSSKIQMLPIYLTLFILLWPQQHGMNSLQVSITMTTNLITNQPTVK